MISKLILKVVVYFKNNLYFKMIFTQKRKLLLSDMSKLILSLRAFTARANTKSVFFHYQQSQ